MSTVAHPAPWRASAAAPACARRSPRRRRRRAHPPPGARAAPPGRHESRRFRRTTPRAPCGAAVEVALRGAWPGTQAAGGPPSPATGRPPLPHLRPGPWRSRGPGATAESGCAAPSSLRRPRSARSLLAPPRLPPHQSRGWQSPAGLRARRTASTREEAPRSAAAPLLGLQAVRCPGGRGEALWPAVACASSCAPECWTRCCCAGSAWRQAACAGLAAGRAGWQARKPFSRRARFTDPWLRACGRAACLRRRG